MPLPLAAVAAGAARFAGPALARGAASKFGGGALAQGAANQGSAQHPRGMDAGATRWARDNPGEAAIGLTAAVMSSSHLSQAADSAYQGVISSSQFGR